MAKDGQHLCIFTTACFLTRKRLNKLHLFKEKQFKNNSLRVRGVCNFRFSLKTVLYSQLRTAKLTRPDAEKQCRSCSDSVRTFVAGATR